MPTAIASVDREGRILFVNAVGAEHLASSRESLIGRSLYELFPDHAAVVRQRIRQAIERRGIQRFETVVDLPSGRRAFLETMYCPTFDSDGTVTAVHMVAEDVTEARRAQRDRSDGSEMWGRATDDWSMTAERLSAILKNAPMVITVQDPDMTIRHINWTRPMTDLNEVIGSSPALWITEAGMREFESGFVEVIEHQRVVERRVQGKSGKTWLARLAPLIHDGQVKQILSCTIDITEQVRLEAELWHRQKTESLGTMAGGIAHDFNNLLSTIMGNVGLAERWLDTGRDPAAFLSNTNEAARKAAELCQQMLAYAGQERPALVAGSLNMHIEQMTRLTRAAVSARIRTDYQLAEDLPLIRCNEAQLGQVLLNLINNAADAIGDEQGRITISTEAFEVRESLPGYLPRPPSPGRYVRLRVTDTGQGMEPDSLPRIFDPYYSTKSSGHGLGLSAVLGIVSSHHAAISVDSEVGVGTTMTVLFPVHDEGEEQVEDAPAAPSWARGEGTVLIVDDEAIVRDTAAAVLEEAGYDVMQAADGDQALALLAASDKPVRAILLDVTMSGRDGYSTLAELRSSDPRVPVLLSSGKPTRSSVGSEDPYVRLLPKPYTASELTAAVAAAMRSE